MSKYLEGLNENQKDAVLTTDGMVQICSVAGSGKTRVLTNRTAYMIKEKGIKAEHILLTTFTKKATNEMKDRLKKMISEEEIDSMTIGTTHSIGHRILRVEYDIMNNPLKNAFNKSVIKNWQQKKFIEDEIKIMKKLSPMFSRDLHDITTPQVLKVISNAKNNNIDYMQFEQKYAGSSSRMEVYSQLYRTYEMKKQEECLIDFDDMLFLLVRLFQENPDVLKKYQDKIQYIMVDEAQDNNLLQYQLVSMLARPQYNVFVVGDDDQSMYKFRGASPQSFIDFSNNYNEKVKQIPLTVNYRSNSDILDTANKLIHYNQNRIPKRLIPHKESESESVIYNVYNNELTEGEEVIKEIESLNSEGFDYKDIAILYRTNAQSRAFEDELIFAGIPYTLHGGFSFYERKEVKDLISYMQLAYNTNDNKAFERIYNTPNRFLGKAFLRDIKQVKNESLFEATNDIKLKKYQKENVSSFKYHILQLKAMSNSGHTLDKMIEYIMNDIGYRKFMLNDTTSSDEDNGEFENIDTLIHLVSQFDSLEKFIEHIEKMMNKRKMHDEGVQLMTIHKSKGLEFPIVFSVGVSEGLLPHIRALEEESDNPTDNPIEEERRLMYVAITRAEKRCYISSLSSYNDKGLEESRFITEMELEMEENNDEEIDGEAS